MLQGKKINHTFVLLLMTNQGGHRISKVSSMIQKNCSSSVWVKNWPKPKPWTLYTIGRQANLVAILCSDMTSHTCLTHVKNMRCHYGGQPEVSFSRNP